MGDRDVTPGASVCKQSERHGTDGRMTEGRGVQPVERGATRVGTGRR